MRPPRPASQWSARRVERRGRYATYIDSHAWFAHREWWYVEHLRRTGAEPVCAVCGTPWRLREDDLHHTSYARLGDEAHGDLLPICREHHQALHDLWDASPAWRRLGRERATSGIVAALRRRLTEPGTRRDSPA